MCGGVNTETSRKGMVSGNEIRTARGCSIDLYLDVRNQKSGCESLCTQYDWCIGISPQLFNVICDSVTSFCRAARCILYGDSRSLKSPGYHSSCPPGFTLIEGITLAINAIELLTGTPILTPIKNCGQNDDCGGCYAKLPGKITVPIIVPTTTIMMNIIAHVNLLITNLYHIS